MKDDVKELMILEYNPIQDLGHICNIRGRSLMVHSSWKKLGIFYGTTLQADNELERRIKRYKKENKI